MNRKLNPDQVVAMFKTGFNKKNIAKRLGASEKQVQRILASYPDQPDQRHFNDRLGTVHEYALWLGWYHMLKSFSSVAYRFGVTRQAVEQKLASITQ